MADNAKKKTQTYQSDDNMFGDADDQSMLTVLNDTDSQDAEENPRSGRGNQGFASMSKEKQREIASKGGKAAHEAGTAHEWTSEEAAEAGRRGGQKRSAAA